MEIKIENQIKKKKKKVVLERAARGGSRTAVDGRRTTPSDWTAESPVTS